MPPKKTKDPAEPASGGGAESTPSPAPEPGDSTMAQHDCWKLTRVHEHAGSGATHLSLVAHRPLSIDMLPHGLYVTRVPPIGVVLDLY